MGTMIVYSPEDHFLKNPADMFIDFKERGSERESEGGRQVKRETSIGCFPYVPNQGLNLQPRYVP